MTLMNGIWDICICEHLHLVMTCLHNVCVIYYPSQNFYALPKYNSDHTSQSSWWAWIIWDICICEHLLLRNRKGLACGTKPTVCTYKQKQMLPSLNECECLVQRSLINKNTFWIAGSAWLGKKTLPVKQYILLISSKMIQTLADRPMCPQVM